MYKHLARSETRSFWGFARYQLSARLYVTPDERRILTRHRLQRIEIFHDPVRDDLEASTIAAHDSAKARGLFVTKVRDAAAITASEISAITSAIRALRAFRITVGDLLDGVTITHRSLREIGHIEQILKDSIDDIDQSLQTAVAYSGETEDIFMPGTDDDTTPPAEWPRVWRP
jgi:hypothetical protein